MAQELADEAAEEAKRKEQEAEAAAKAGIEELLAQIAKEQELLDQMLRGEPPLIEVRVVPDSFELGEGCFQITGVVGDADAPLRTLTINGERLPLFKLADDADGIAKHSSAFRYTFTPTDEGDQTFVIVVTDASQTTVTQEVQVTITVANRPNILGKNYALIIGNNEYDLLPTLKTAVGDAEAIAEVLYAKYDYDCQWRSKKGPLRRCKKGPLGGCGLVPVVHGRAPRATRRALNRLTRRRAREGPVGPRGQAWAGWSVQLAVGV